MTTKEATAKTKATTTTTTMANAVLYGNVN
jgi:hypothetical protein